MTKISEGDNIALHKEIRTLHNVLHDTLKEPALFGMSQLCIRDIAKIENKLAMYYNFFPPPSESIKIRLERFLIRWWYRLCYTE